MFTGIVQGKAKVIHIKGNNELSSFTFKFPAGTLDDIKEGASIAINGTCLTVTEFDLDQNTSAFDAIEQTIRLTNLGSLKIDDCVNFERAAKIGDEIGGHLMSGHIHSVVEIIDIKKTKLNCLLYFKNHSVIAPYLLDKGFVGLNGCSLTLAEVTDDYFCVHLIPETLKITTFGQLEIGSNVNLEIDPQTQSIVDTVNKVLKNRSS